MFWRLWIGGVFSLEDLMGGSGCLEKLISSQRIRLLW